MQVKGEIFYATSSKRVTAHMNSRAKLGLQPFGFSATDMGDAVNKLQQLLDKGKGLLPKKIEYTECNCVVVLAEPLEGQSQPLQFVYDRVLDVAAGYKPRAASEYTAEEKIAAFDKLHAYALSVWNDHKEGKADDDEDHWSHEALMPLLARNGDGRSFWEAFNALGDLAKDEED